MQNFIYSIPTVVYFGKGKVEKLGSLAAESGKRALLVYGGGSIKKNGVYDQIMDSLEKSGITVTELGGVEPNPKIESVRKGAELCREKEISCVIAAGGGSSIDCAKGIAAAACYDSDAWDLVKNPNLIRKALPILTVPTAAATGSEMDFYAVLSNPDTKEKISIDSPVLFPKYSILDPDFTKTVPLRQTAAGTADILSHIFEVYFLRAGDTQIQDGIMESLMRTVIRNGRTVMKDPGNYDARANLQWASDWAINGFICCGKAGAWVCHPMEHQLSAYYDIVHGEGLAVLMPAWLRYTLNDRTVDMVADFGCRVFGMEDQTDRYRTAEQAIAELEGWLFEDLHLPRTLRECGVPEDAELSALAEGAARSLSNAYVPLSKKDVLEIYKAAF
ncbi:MAG: iron-containing alcohol dehydrogenase [Bilifractor sp.]|jgi:alcohol dehydrogenase YqhD (iron-dependent ADH family)